VQLSPDQTVYWQWGVVELNATILCTWFVMAVVVVASWMATRGLGAGTRMTRWQNFLETLLMGIREQIREVSGQAADPYLPFVGTLFIFIAVANVLGVLPVAEVTAADGTVTPYGYQSPTGSLSTTAALAFCVFIAVPIYGVARKGVLGYLENYLKPSWVMLPFNVVGEISRTLALAVRLFGNIMSGSLIAAVLLAIAPLLVPVVMNALGLLTGVIQAYIFAMLAMVYVASATEADEQPTSNPNGTRD